MAYNNYTIEEVFNNPSVNVDCNRIINTLLTDFKDDYPNNFLLTGTAAKIIQADPAQPVKNIAFITTNKTIYNYLQKNFHKIIAIEGLLAFTDRLQITTKVYNLEIWYTTTPLLKVTVNTIDCQEKTSIPSNII